MNNATNANTILEKGIFFYHWKKQKQYYKIDLLSPCKVGGMNEDGYKLKQLDGEPSGLVITYIDALRLAAGAQLEINSAKVTFIKQ